jgi:hypothetical protein
MIKNVIAIDPGTKYVGLATRRDGVYQAIELNDYHMLWIMLNDIDWDVVLCENFTAKYISRFGLGTVRIIGGVEEICWRRKILFETRQNVTRLKYVKNKQADAKVRSLIGYNIRDHMTDAMSHLMAWEEHEP